MKGDSVVKSVFILLFTPLVMLAQSVYLPASHPVYRYLDKMEAKRIITDYRDMAKPLLRSSIAGMLTRIDSLDTRLTSVEREERYFYLEEFHDELQRSGYAAAVEDRWHGYEYVSGAGNFNFDIIGGYSHHLRADGTTTTIISNGVSAYGSVNDNLGISLMFRDNHESGSTASVSKPLTPAPSNILAKITGSSIQYDIVDAQATYTIGNATLSIEKLHNVWGTGERGSLILSDKAPSFPQVKLRIPFGDDLDFTYFHGWLASDLIDSLRSYQVRGIPGGTGFRRQYVQKYIAAHILEYSLFTGWDFALGESQVYGGRNPELLFLIPVMFFKAAEHWNMDTDNSQLFLSAKVHPFAGHAYYYTVFIDELVTTDIVDPDKQRNQLGFTVGGSWYDLLHDDMRMMVEYTRTNPWVYNHKYPDATYESHSVELGHWIGQNADLFSAGIWFRPMRSLEAGIMFESLRKGGKDSTRFQYLLPTPSFLYGPVTKRQTFGLVGSYEPVRDMIVDFHFLRSRFTTSVTSTTPAFVNNPNEYIVTPSYSGEWDIFVGIRYNFD